MIEGGYYLKAKRIKKSAISKAHPCTREVWDYLLREARFTDTEELKSGQVKTSYKQIIENLSWKHRNGFKSYSQDRVKKAMVFLRKHKMIESKPNGKYHVLVTICNYKEYQNFRNYKHSLSTEQEPEDTSKINTLESSKSFCGTENTVCGTEKEPVCGTEPKPEDTSKINGLETSKSFCGTEKKPLYAPILYINTPVKEDIVNTSTGNYAGKTCPPPVSNDPDFDRDRRLFFDCFPGAKCFQTFDDNQDRKDKSLISQIHVVETVTWGHIEKLEDYNSRGAGVYLTINETDGKGRLAKNIIRVRSVFADLDGAPLDPVWDYNPSMVIETSPGKYHAYWLVVNDEANGVPLAGFRQLQECISVKFGSDPKPKDLPRVMRVPGFQHMKHEPFLSKIIHYTGQEHTFGYLSDLFPPAPRKQWSGEKYQHQFSDNNTGEFKGQYGASEGNRNDHLAKRAGGMIKRGLPWPQIEDELWKEAQACCPPLPEGEVRQVIRSMRRYAS